MSLHSFNITTNSRNELINIDRYLSEALKKSGVTSGRAVVFCPHTTGAITINENADPAVKEDILSYLKKLIPSSAGFTHLEGNSDSHIKSSLLGASTEVIIEKGKALLGTWQSLFFAEFDGPRSRKFHIKIMSD